ncbi:MAG TPA: ribosomal protein S18-alanine N-acetyltransferase [Polyangia bacterium]|nr:ribosomal protein S18-alanine N-acetyltransferase [Polyangia bacterium]
MAVNKASLPYLIQPLTAADLDAVVEIERLSFRTPWPRQAFEEEMARSWARVDVLHDTVAGRPVAFADYWLVADELHILNIATHPEARRQGHGARLLRHILDLARRASYKTIELEVRRSNLAAQALYRHFEFRQVGIRTRYYEDNDEDAIVMTLRLRA